MATDDERREVAERLRAARGPSLMVLMDVLGVGGAHLFARLADLIDPDTTKTAEDTTKSAEDTTKAQKSSEITPTSSDITPNSHPDLGTEEVQTSQVPECDREALLALADKMKRYARLRSDHGMDVDAMAVRAWVFRIREACGVVA